MRSFFVSVLVLFTQASLFAQVLDNDRYEAARSAWFLSDSLMQQDIDITLNPLELRVDQKLQALREQMIGEYKTQNFFPPARYFYQSQAHMEETRLFQLLQKMPKAGIHHVHGSSMGDIEWILDKAVSADDAYLFWEEGSQKYVKGQFMFFKKGEVPEGFQSIKKLKKKEPTLKEQLRDLYTLDRQSDLDSVDIWYDFERYFIAIDGLVYYQPFYKDFYRAAYHTLLEDGVRHFELRVNLTGPLYDLDHELGYFNGDTIVAYHQDLVKELREAYPDFSVKLIYTSLRFFPQELLEQKLTEAFELRKKYPDWVIGFDLVGEEDNGETTDHFRSMWLKLAEMEKEYGIDMPLYLHDGESNWQSNQNLYDAVLLNSRRIGHGFNLIRYPGLWDRLKQRDICIEVCPLSNQILGYVRDLRNHPALTYFRMGIPVSISSDDPCNFGYLGVTPDYWSVFLAWELDLQALKQLLRNSLLYSALSSADKEKALEAWEKDWQAYMAYVDGELE